MGVYAAEAVQTMWQGYYRPNQQPVQQNGSHNNFCDALDHGA